MAITHSKVSAKPDGSDTSKVRPSDWNAEHVDENGNPIRAFTYADIQLNNADILALPGNPIQFLPAPGDGLGIWFLYGYVVIDTRGGAYVDAPDVNLVTGTNIDNLFSNVKLQSAQLLTLSALASGGDKISNNEPLVVNDQTGNSPTGGDPANTISIRAYYMIVPTVSFTP